MKKEHYKKLFLSNFHFFSAVVLCFGVGHKRNPFSSISFKLNDGFLGSLHDGSSSINTEGVPVKKLNIYSIFYNNENFFFSI